MTGEAFQHCPNARTSIKFLAIDDRYDVISSGSLLGLYYRDIVSIPVGYEKPIEMYSLDFEEFLWAYGYDDKAIASMKEYYTAKETIPKSIHEKFQKILREYLIVGGMPDVVNTFFETNNFQETYSKQLALLTEYENDIKKYAKTTDRPKITAQTQVALMNDELTGPAKGGIYENLIFDMLLKRGYKLYYTKKADSTQEIEFLIEQNLSVISIEVKSRRGSTLSLNQFLKDWKPPYSYKLSGANAGQVDNKITLPHYLAMFI